MTRRGGTCVRRTGTSTHSRIPIILGLFRRRGAVRLTFSVVVLVAALATATAMLAGCGGEEASQQSPPPTPPVQPGKDGASTPARTPGELALGESATDPTSGLQIDVGENVKAYDTPPDAPGAFKGKATVDTLPGFDPASERLLVFDVGVSNPTDRTMSLNNQAFTLEDKNGNRFERVIHSAVVRPAESNPPEYLPGQSRRGLWGFQAPRDGQDLRLVFRPTGSAVAMWKLPSVSEIPDSGVPAEPTR